MSNSVAIFWDYENLHPPKGLSGYEIVKRIENAIHSFGHVSLFKAYLDINDSETKYRQLHGELQLSGVSIIHCPHNGRKDVVDKVMLVDMVAFAIDHPPPATVVIISGDSDFSYCASTLKLRGYNVVLVSSGKDAILYPWPQTNVVLNFYAILSSDSNECNEAPTSRTDPIMQDGLLGSSAPESGPSGEVHMQESSSIALPVLCPTSNSSSSSHWQAIALPDTVTMPPSPGPSNAPASRSYCLSILKQPSKRPNSEAENLGARPAKRLRCETNVEGSTRQLSSGEPAHQAPTEKTLPNTFVDTPEPGDSEARDPTFEVEKLRIFLPLVEVLEGHHLPSIKWSALGQLLQVYRQTHKYTGMRPFKSYIMAAKKAGVIVLRSVPSEKDKKRNKKLNENNMFIELRDAYRTKQPKNSNSKPIERRFSARLAGLPPSLSFGQSGRPLGPLR